MYHLVPLLMNKQHLYVCVFDAFLFRIIVHHREKEAPDHPTFLTFVVDLLSPLQLDN